MSVDRANFLALYGLAGVEEVEGETERARDLYLEAARVRQWSMPNAALGRLLHKTGEHADAKLYFERAIAMAPRVVSYKADFGMLLADMGLYEEAIEQFSIARSKLGRYQEPEMLARYGDCLTLLGRVAEADEVFTFAIGFAAHDPVLWIKRGYARMELGKDDAAKSDFERVIELAPDWSSGFAARGEWARRRQDSRAGRHGFHTRAGVGRRRSRPRAQARLVAGDGRGRVGEEPRRGTPRHTQGPAPSASRWIRCGRRLQPPLLPR